VCYESEARCQFTCGHGFCKDCTKTWYMKGRSTCPMCRGSMCFRGITKLKKEWYQEKREQVLQDLMTQILDELMDEYHDIVLHCLEVVQSRYDYMNSKYPDTSCDMLDLVLRTTWLDIDYMMDTRIGLTFDDDVEYKKYLMVSDNEYGVKNKSLSIIDGTVSTTTRWRTGSNDSRSTTVMLFIVIV